MLPGKKGLDQAFHDFMVQTENNTIDSHVTREGFFSYILTKKQRAQIRKVCAEQDWLDPGEKGVTLTKEYFKHVLDQRKVKDDVNAHDCAIILASAYNQSSEVAINKPRFQGDVEREQQALIFNAQESITVKKSRNLYGVAIIEISIKKLSPVTAYHARGDKVNAFKRKR